MRTVAGFCDSSARLHQESDLVNERAGARAFRRGLRAQKPSCAHTLLLFFAVSSTRRVACHTPHRARCERIETSTEHVLNWTFRNMMLPFIVMFLLGEQIDVACPSGYLTSNLYY
jgi:hypothetical protein